VSSYVFSGISKINVEEALNAEPLNGAALMMTIIVAKTRLVMEFSLGFIFNSPCGLQKKDPKIRNRY
jgi:hypothetical protein